MDPESEDLSFLGPGRDFLPSSTVGFLGGNTGAFEVDNGGYSNGLGFLPGGTFFLPPSSVPLATTLEIFLEGTFLLRGGDLKGSEDVPSQGSVSDSSSDNSENLLPVSHGEEFFSISL